MKRNIAFSALLAMALIGCDSATPTSEDSNSNSSATSNSSASTVDTSRTSHYQGTACLRCHGTNPTEINEGNEEVLTSGATLYSAINAQNGDSLVSDYSVRLVLENSNLNVDYERGRGEGNQVTQFPVGNINLFTAQVLDANGVVVNTSITNSHDLSRLDCNKCHTQAGTNGAPGRIVNFDYQGLLSNAVSSSSSSTSSSSTSSSSMSVSTSSAPIANATSFKNDVLPVLIDKCKKCHGTNGRFTISDTNSSATISNIFSFGFANLGSVDDSLLLSKSSNRVTHVGGEVLKVNSPEYQTIRTWISEGATNN